MASWWWSWWSSSCSPATRSRSSSPTDRSTGRCCPGGSRPACRSRLVVEGAVGTGGGAVVPTLTACVVAGSQPGDRDDPADDQDRRRRHRQPAVRAARRRASGGQRLGRRCGTDELVDRVADQIVVAHRSCSRSRVRASASSRCTVRTDTPSVVGDLGRGAVLPVGEEHDRPLSDVQPPHGGDHLGSHDRLLAGLERCRQLLAAQSPLRRPALLAGLVEHRPVQVCAAVLDAVPPRVGERLQHRRGDEIICSRGARPARSRSARARAAWRRYSSPSLCGSASTDIIISGVMPPNEDRRHLPPERVDRGAAAGPHPGSPTEPRSPRFSGRIDPRCDTPLVQSHECDLMPDRPPDQASTATRGHPLRAPEPIEVLRVRY